MQVQRPAQRPCLHERAVAPERVAHVLLRDAVDARGQLQLGGRLHLRVNSADLAARHRKDPRNAPSGSCARGAARAPAPRSEKALAIDQLAAGQPCVPIPRWMICTCAADGSSSTCSSRYVVSQARTASSDSTRATRSPSTRTAYCDCYPPTSMAKHARGSHFSELLPGGFDRRTSATAAVVPAAPTVPRLPGVTVVRITRRTFRFLPGSVWAAACPRGWPGESRRPQADAWPDPIPQ